MLGFCVRSLAPLFVVAFVFFGLESFAHAQATVISLAELRQISSLVNNATVSLSPNHGDPHPVTGIVTPGEYWINGDHIADPTNTAPRFLILGGNGNTFNFAGTTIFADTRKFDGYGRNLGHESGIDIIRLEGSNNLVQDLTLIGRDIALDTDPNAQRYADWGTQFFELSGDNNTVDGAHIVSRGSRTDTYGLSDAFGKGASQGMSPFIAHRKASTFRVGEATNAVVNDVQLECYTFGHCFFVQASTNTTITNSTILAESFSSQLVVDRPEYQAAGHTWWGEPIPNDIMLSGAEGGVRVYTGASGLTVDNVIVDGARTGFATVHDGGQVNISNSFAFNTTSGFDVGDNTTITGCGGNIVNGPLLVFYGSGNNTTIELELTGGAPIGTNWSAAYFNGNADISISSDLDADDLPLESFIRLGQNYFENWRDHDYRTSTPEDGNPREFNDQIFINDSNQIVVIGQNAVGNVGRSQGGVISNGRENYYDGVTYVLEGALLQLVHERGLGNSGSQTGAEFSGGGSIAYAGTPNAETPEDNGTVVVDGGTLEIGPGLNIIDEQVTISGDGIDGGGAIYSDGSVNNRTRLVGDGDIVVLDGDASIGVGVSGNQLLIDRIAGVGDFTKLGAGKLSVGVSSTFDGDLIVAEGALEGRTGVVRTNLEVASGGSVRAIGDEFLQTLGQVSLDGIMDLNARLDPSILVQQVGALSGSGQVILSNLESGSGAVLEIVGDDHDEVFTGSIVGAISLLKTGSGFQSLAGTLNHTGTTTVVEGGLQVDGIHVVGGAYSVTGGSLGGAGVVDSDVTVIDGGGLAPGGFFEDIAGTLIFGGNYVQDSQSTLWMDIDAALASDQLVVGGLAALSGALDLASTDPLSYRIGDTMTLISAQSVFGQFESIEGVQVGVVDGFASGLAVQYDSFGVTARVTILGDTNFDDQVDVLTDAFRMISSLGVTSGATFAEGDFNGDGQVDVLNDAFAMISNLGASL